MAIQECGNGHLYDTDQDASCPYCQGDGNRINFAGSEVGRTVGVAPAARAAEVGATVAPVNYTRQQDRGDTGKTVGVFQKKMSFEPVVGWLVCIEGPEKGKDFRIYGRNNTVGRSEKMDICLKGDSTISRENHARLAYDEKHNAFHLIPAESTNTIYLNDEPVYVPAKLTSYDVIEFGDCKLVFVPFCNERFTWQTGLKQD